MASNTLSSAHFPLPFAAAIIEVKGHYCLGVPYLEVKMGNSSGAVSQRLEHASKTGVLSLAELKLEEVR